MAMREELCTHVYRLTALFHFMSFINFDQAYVTAVLTRVNTVTGVAWRDDPTILGK